MTKQQMIEFIRQKCIEANPEIVELKFGCLINDQYTMLLRCGGDFGNEIMQTVDTRTGEAGSYFASYIDDGNGDSRLETVEDWIKNEEIEIIGRHLRLADVLLAMNATHKLPAGSWITSDPYICFHHADTDEELCTWNLRQDNINDQDESTIEFIYEVLK